MKKLVLLTVLLTIGVLTVQAQHETLFGRAKVVGGFGAPILEFGLSNGINNSVGGGGGVIIDNFFIGGYGLGSIDFEQILEDNTIDRLDIGHGGFWLGLSLWKHKLVHLYTDAKIGWGAINIDLDDNFFEEDQDQIFVATPALGVEMNVTSWFRISGTAGYRWIDGAAEGKGYTNEDFTGAVATVNFRFGWFGWHR